ncbi:acyltransferase [uncultured Massilia sp.]|uniref:acyltransferase family protein n=1 Tax=uncultured Massilia sp. TaxID=169973 RepID=UPI0025E4A60C|nr:acyltransferase [uncultured Massilia sp.]
MRHHDNQRLAGLDTLRACAILLVLMSHYASFVSRGPTFGVLGQVGWAGVDLFFVLSGYLIGNQLLAPVALGEAPGLTTFFARRLLRTLPNYYAVLAVYLLFPQAPFAGSGAAPLWQFLTFTQNFGLAYGQTFTHSWSLCIEEQFYVVLPLAVLALARTRSLRLAWCVLLGAIALGMTVRGMAWLRHGHHFQAAEVYYASACRFDELLPGVALAMLKHFHRARFTSLLRHANALLAAGLAGAVGLLACMHRMLPGEFAVTAFGFSLVAMSFALLVGAALAPHCLLNRVRIPGAASLALWSYAVYLVHKPVFMALRAPLGRLGIDPEAPAAILAVMGLGILGGWLLYRLVETPCMRLRARWFPASPAAPGAAPAPAIAPFARPGA